jgi:hypothetical protein
VRKEGKNDTSRVWLKYPNVHLSTMSTALLIMGIFALFMITTFNLNMMLIYAEDSSELPYCAKGEGKDGISIKICSVDKEKCDKNVKENEISVSCDRSH